MLLHGHVHFDAGASEKRRTEPRISELLIVALKSHSRSNQTGDFIMSSNIRYMNIM